MTAGEIAAVLRDALNVYEGYDPNLEIEAEPNLNFMARRGITDFLSISAGFYPILEHDLREALDMPLKEGAVDTRRFKGWARYDRLVKAAAEKAGLQVDYAFKNGWVVVSPVERAGEVYACFNNGVVTFNGDVHTGEGENGG